MRPERSKYIRELERGPKTTGDMVMSLMVTRNAVWTAMKKLCAAGIVKSERVTGVVGNVWRHELIPGYEAILKAQSRVPISKELMLVAELRDDGYTGLRLDAEHAKWFPACSRRRMCHLVAKAQAQGLCR